ncbi:MAG: cysteine desulfurase NifS [Tenericutes bacterium]|nr:cysteine desulfurase NifS [Mycoplasmatota bacterium]
MKIKYFDNAATTAVDKDIINYMMPYFSENYYNPSSIYTPSREAFNAIEESRKKVANVINANANEIYFTSGGTESDNLAIKGFAYANKKKGNHIITSSIEHPAVINTCKTLEKEGFEVTYLKVDNNGLISLNDLEKSIKDNTILISIMTANNEIGTIEPIKEIGNIAKNHNIAFHTDAVQAIGAMNIDVKDMNISMLSLSSHKFYGPKGVGALYVKKGTLINRLNDGGHQENNKRSGTENVPCIVGLGFAIEKAHKELDENVKKITELRDYYIKEIESKLQDVILNGDRVKRLPGNANFSFKHIEGESILLLLDAKGICVSTGSACSSKSLEPSYVLLSIGLAHEVAHGSIRVSIGKHNTKEEVDFLIESIIEVVNKLREMSPLYEEN